MVFGTWYQRFYNEMEIGNDNESTAIVKWEGVGTAIVLYTEQPNDTTLEDIIDKFSDAIQYVAPYASKVMQVINLVKPDPIMAKLNEISYKLKELDKKINRMMSEIKGEFKIAEFKKHLNNLNKCQMLFNRYSEKPNKVTLGALRELGYNDLITFAHWLFLELTGQNLSPLIGFMKEENDYPKFLKWSSVVLAHFINAVLYHSLLMRTRNDISKEEIEQTLEKDTKDFTNWLNDIKKVINTQIKWMKDNYLQHMERKVIDTFNEKPKQKIKEEAENILKFVSNKYPFRKWFVGVVRAFRGVGSITNFENLNFISLDTASKQTALLLEYENGNLAVITKFKNYMDNLNFGFSSTQAFIQQLLNYVAKNSTFSFYRLIIISSTLPDQQGRYKENVKRIISGIDESMYRKYKGWIIFNLAESYRRVVKEKLSGTNNSEVMVFRDEVNTPNDNFEAHFEWDAGGAFYHHKMFKRPLLRPPWEEDIITIKLDSL